MWSLAQYEQRLQAYHVLLCIHLAVRTNIEIASKEFTVFSIVTKKETLKNFDNQNYKKSPPNPGSVAYHDRDRDGRASSREIPSFRESATIEPPVHSIYNAANVMHCRNSTGT